MIADRMATPQLIAHQLVLEIGTVASPGLGSWSLAWELVSDATTAFDDELDRFMETPSAAAGRQLVAAARAVVTSWQAAARAWEAEGRPIDLTPGSSREENHREKELNP